MAVKKKTVILWVSLAFLILVGVFAYSSLNAVKNLVELETGESDYFDGSGDIAVMKIEGAIMGAETALAKIRELEEDKHLKAIVLRIDSPGGAVGPSQEIYDAILRLNRKKPVICSMGDLTASGGYYIASACDKIFANPGTLTGSIGVIMHFMNLKNLYAWAKVAPNIIKAGKFKDIGNEARDMTPDETKLLQDMLNEVHRQFKDAILVGRNGDRQTKRLRPEVLEEFADGRIFSGRFAKEKGFVDEIGGEFEALEAAKKIAGVKEPKIIREIKEHKGLRGFFDSETSIAQLAKGFLKEISPTASFDLKPGVPYLLPAYMFSSPDLKVQSR